MALLRLDPQVFVILAALIEERAGLSYGPDDRELLEDRISTRAVDAGFESLLDYYYFLRYDTKGAAELDALVESLVVHESYFFRELEPLRVLVTTEIAPKVAAGGRPRVWCAACAGGEEPLTLAMLLASDGILGSVDIVASDISRRALERAREGRFNRRAVRTESLPELAVPYMTVAEGIPRVRRELREAIDWRRVNLIDPVEVEALGTFDVVVCRNVLIYFRDATVERVARLLAGRLRPDGTLWIGTSESLLRLSTPLECEERSGVFFYRRTGAT